MKRIILLLVLFLSLSPMTAMGAEFFDTESSAISAFIRTKTQEADVLSRDVEALQKRLEQSRPVITDMLAKARERVQTFEVVARMVKTNPYDMRVALADARYAQISLTKEFQQLELLSKDVAAKQQVAQSLSEDLERKWTTGMNATLRGEIQALRKSADAASKKMKTLREQLEAINSSVSDVQTGVSGWITSFESQLTEIWKADFLEKKTFHLLPDSGENSLAGIADWYANMKTFAEEQFTAITEEPGWAGTFALFWLPFIVVSCVAVRHLHKLFENIHTRGRVAAILGILCLSLGLSLLAAFFSGKVRQTSFLLFCTHFFALIGVQALAWVFRNVKGIPPRQILQPLWPLGVLSVSVALLDLLRLPDWFEHLVWVILLVLSSLFFGMIQPVRRYERFIRRAHPYVLAVLVALAILGWGNLAILASTLWGVVALAIQLSLGAASVVRVFFERMDKTGMRAVAADLGVTALTLLVYLVTALGVITWITVNLGTGVVFEKLSTLEFSWGDFSFNFLRLGVVLLLFQVVRSLIAVWKTVLAGDRLGWKNIDRGAAASLQRIGMYCLWMLFGLVSLNLLGISLSNFAVIAGGLSVGIGFGMQTIISNFISGLILLFDRAIQPGDVIEVNGVWGKVMSVNIRNTEVQTFDNAKIFVPNSTLIANNLTNWTHRNDVRMRRDVLVGVAYGSDVQLVKKLLLESATEHPVVLGSPEPAVIFSNFGASSLDFTLRFWVRHVDLGVSASSEIREAIDRKFREHGVEIPFPQMDVRMCSGDGAVRVGMEDGLRKHVEAGREGAEK